MPWIRGWRYLLIAIGLAVLALLIIDFNGRTAELRRLTAQKEVVAEELAGLEQTQSNLQTQVAYATSENAVKEWAYQDGHWVRPGDYPVIPLAPAEITPELTPAPVVTRPVIPNWQLWLSLFVDEMVFDLTR